MVENRRRLRQSSGMKRVHFLTLLFAASWFAGAANPVRPRPQKQ